MIIGELKVEQDHVEGLATIRNPVVGVEELIWNALDADASTVSVATGTNELGGLSTITVSDDGFGICFDDCSRAFGSLGGSHKKVVPTTPSGRTNHGKLGKGRFKALGVGSSIVWQSRYGDDGNVKQFEVTVRKSALKRYDVTDAKSVRGNRTGVKATVKGIDGRHASLLDAEQVADELARRLALYLKKYPGIEITYDGHKIDPAKLQSHVETYEVVIPDIDGTETPAEITVIEWNTATDRAMYFCDDNGFALEESAPGIKAPGFHFTVYVKSSAIPQLVEEGAFAVEGLHPRVQAIHRTTKELLRGHFRRRDAARAKDFVDQWQQEDVYPYAPNEVDVLKTAEKEVFDVCAAKVQTYLKHFDKSDTQSKRLTFRLIREALESNPEKFFDKCLNCRRSNRSNWRLCLNELSWRQSSTLQRPSLIDWTLSVVSMFCCLAISRRYSLNASNCTESSWKNSGYLGNSTHLEATTSHSRKCCKSIWNFSGRTSGPWKSWHQSRISMRSNGSST